MCADDALWLVREMTLVPIAINKTVGHDRIAKKGVVLGYVAQVCAFQICPGEIGLGKGCVPEAGSDQLGVFHVRPLKICAGNIRGTEVCFDHICADEFRPNQVRRH